MIRRILLLAALAMSSNAYAQSADPLDALWVSCSQRGDETCDQIAAAAGSTAQEKALAFFNRAIGYENAAIPAAQAQDLTTLNARRADALNAYARALKAVPDLGVALYNQARLNQGANRKPQAFAGYTATIAADPVLAPDALALRARLQISHGDYAAAAADAAESIRRRPDAAQGYLVHAEALRRQGSASLADAEEARGYRLLSPAERKDFSEVGEFSGFARVGFQPRPTRARRLATLFARGAAAYGFPAATPADAIRAVKEFDAAVALAPTLAAPYQQRGEAQFAARNLTAARDDFEKCLEIALRDAPDFAHTCLHGRGKVREAGGSPAEALADYDAAVAAQGANAAYRNSACWARGVLNRELEHALADCNEAVRLRPKNPAFLDSRALVKLRSGDFADAEADYSAAIRAAGNDFPHAQYGRGVARLRQQKETEGRADITAASNADPTLPARFEKFGLAP